MVIAHLFLFIQIKYSEIGIYCHNNLIVGHLKKVTMVTYIDSHIYI